MFDCNCEACMGEWPCYSALPATRPSTAVAARLVELERGSMAALQTDEVDAALTAHCCQISLIHSELGERHQLAVAVRTSFTHCWWRKIHMMVNQTLSRK